MADPSESAVAEVGEDGGEAAGPAVLTVEGLRHELDARQRGEGYQVHVGELHLPLGEFVCILGGTGCGKTTLLTILGLAREPSWKLDGGGPVRRFEIVEYEHPAGAAGPVRGEVHDLCGFWKTKAGKRRALALRRRLLGFCLQSGELLPNLTVFENVAMPLRLNDWSGARAAERVGEVLRHLGDTIYPDDLWDRRNFLPNRLSGGQFQRVALARALAHRPKVLFIDEPTGALNATTARKALNALENEMQANRGMTVVMVTHDQALAEDYGRYIVEMTCHEGRQGTIERYRRKVNGSWAVTDAAWRPLPATEGDYPRQPR